MALFGKQQPGTGGATASQIQSMRQQGYADNQIIQMLQNQGYQSQQIFEAMSMAEAANAPQQQMAMPQQQVYPAQDQRMMGGGQELYDVGSSVDDRERIEEVAEAIIDEKWNDLLKDINKISDFNAKTESRLTKIEQDIKNLRDNFDSLHRGVLGKISDYDRNLVSVGTEIKAMEKVFQKILPAFTDNVNRLARITDSMPAVHPQPQKQGQGMVVKKRPME